MLKKINSPIYKPPTKRTPPVYKPPTKRTPPSFLM